jgi:hypothetical protein
MKKQLTAVLLPALLGTIQISTGENEVESNLPTVIITSGTIVKLGQ